MKMFTAEEAMLPHCHGNCADAPAFSNCMFCCTAALSLLQCSVSKCCGAAKHYSNVHQSTVLVCA